MVRSQSVKLDWNSSNPPFPNTQPVGASSLAATLSSFRYTSVVLPSLWIKIELKKFPSGHLTHAQPDKTAQREDWVAF